jgi:hypothetical protein
MTPELEQLARQKMWLGWIRNGGHWTCVVQKEDKDACSTILSTYKADDHLVLPEGERPDKAGALVPTKDSRFGLVRQAAAWIAWQHRGGVNAPWVAADGDDDKQALLKRVRGWDTVQVLKRGQHPEAPR